MTVKGKTKKKKKAAIRFLPPIVFFTRNESLPIHFQSRYQSALLRKVNLNGRNRENCPDPAEKEGGGQG